jgi:hypothetical protein
MISRVVSALYRFARDTARDTARMLPLVLAFLLVVWIVASPWILFWGGGWHLLLRWYLLPYPFVLLGVGLITAFVKRRELLVRVRNWRAARTQRN